MPFQIDAGEGDQGLAVGGGIQDRGRGGRGRDLAGLQPYVGHGAAHVHGCGRRGGIRVGAVAVIQQAAHFRHGGAVELAVGIVVSGLVLVHRDHQVVRAVVEEGHRQGDRDPAGGRRHVHIACEDLGQVGQRQPVGCRGERVIGGMSHVHDPVVGNRAGGHAVPVVGDGIDHAGAADLSLVVDHLRIGVAVVGVDRQHGRYICTCANLDNPTANKCPEVPDRTWCSQPGVGVMGYNLPGVLGVVVQGTIAERTRGSSWGSSNKLCHGSRGTEPEVIGVGQGAKGPGQVAAECYVKGIVGRAGIGGKPGCVDRGYDHDRRGDVFRCCAAGSLGSNQGAVVIVDIVFIFIRPAASGVIRCDLVIVHYVEGEILGTITAGEGDVRKNGGAVDNYRQHSAVPAITVAVNQRHIPCDCRHHADYGEQHSYD